MMHTKRALWITGTALLQICFGQFFRIDGIVPNLLLIFTVCYACIERDIFYSVLAAGICGLLLDVCSGRAFGIRLLGFLYSVLLIQVVSGFWEKDRFWYALCAVFFCTIFTEVLFHLFAFRALAQGFRTAFLYTIFPEAIYQTVLGVILYPFIRKTFREKNKSYRRNRI